MEDDAPEVAPLIMPQVGTEWQRKQLVMGIAEERGTVQICEPVHRDGEPIVTYCDKDYPASVYGMPLDKFTLHWRIAS